MKNPFVFGKVVRGDFFLNREKEIETISETLLSGQNIICYSPRRYGKTSLMIQVGDKLKDQGSLVFFIDLFRVTSLNDLFNIYSSSIAESINTPVKSLVKTIQSLLPSINPKIVFKSPDSPSVEVSVPIPILSKSQTLHELFNSLEEYCKSNKKKGTVIFDEFQELTSIKEGNLIEREMRSAFQFHEHVSYAFLGSKHNLLKGIFKNKNRPFYNFGKHYELDVIDANHWEKFISQKMGKKINKDIIPDILNITENHPYFTQMFCHYLWNYLNISKSEFSRSEIKIVLSDIIEREELFMSDLWERLKIKERHLLKAIAIESPKNIYESSFLIRNSLGSSSVQKSITKLMDLDYIRKFSSGEFTFVNPLFKQWILSDRND